jgi:hypothetical protein
MKRVYATAPATRGWSQFVSYDRDEVRDGLPLTVYVSATETTDTGLLDAHGAKIFARDEKPLGFLAKDI